MNAEGILTRLAERRGLGVTELELRELISHIGYLEKVCGVLLKAVTENKVIVYVPQKEILRQDRGPANDKATWGNECA